jgi:hypothetical protein
MWCWFADVSENPATSTLRRGDYSGLVAHTDTDLYSIKLRGSGEFRAPSTACLVSSGFPTRISQHNSVYFLGSHNVLLRPQYPPLFILVLLGLIRHKQRSLYVGRYFYWKLEAPEVINMPPVSQRRRNGPWRVLIGPRNGNEWRGLEVWK